MEHQTALCAEKPRRNSTGREVKSWLYGELDRLAALPPGWDREGADPMDPAIVTAARQLVAALPDDTLGTPAVVPIADGNLQLEWNDGPRSLELEIADPRTIHYLKWLPEEGIEEENFFSIDDVGRAVSLIRWFHEG
jgi:hypothetical protein